MIVKVLCSALLFLAFGTIAHGEPRFDHTIRHVDIYGTTKLDVKVTETTFHVDDETLPYLESKKIDELIGVANQREFRVSDILKALRAGQEPQVGSSEEQQDNTAEPEKGSDGSQLGPNGSQQVRNGSQQVPDGSQQVPDGSQQVPDGSQQVPDASQQVPNGSQQVPNGSQQVPDGSQQVPDGSQQVPDGSQQGPEGSPQGPKGSQQVPDASQQDPDGSQQGPERSQQGPKGSQQVPERSQQGPKWSQQDPDGSQLGPDESELGSGALTGEADEVKDNGQNGNVSDDTVDQKNGDDANNNVDDQDGGENDDNPDKEKNATVDEDQNGDEEPDEYDDDNDYDDGDLDDIDDEKRYRDKKKRPRSKQNNRSKSGESQRSQGKSKPTKNSQNSRSNQKPQSSRSNQKPQGSRTNQTPQSPQPKQTSPNPQTNSNSQNSQPNQKTGNTQPSRKPGATRTDQKSPASRPKDGTTNSQRQGTKRTSSSSRTSKQRQVGTKRFKGGRRGHRLHGLRGRSSVFRKIRDETLRNYPKNNLRDPKSGNPPSETPTYNDPRNGIPYSAGGGSAIVAVGDIGGTGGGGIAAGGGAALGTAAGAAFGIGGPMLVSVGGGVLKKVADLATPVVNSRVGGDQRSYQPPKSPVDIHSNNSNTNNKRPGYPDKVNLNDRHGPQVEDLPDQNGEDDIGVPNSDDPELTQQDEDDPENLSPTEDLFNYKSEDDLNGRKFNGLELTQLGEDNYEELTPNGDLSHQQGKEGFDNRKPANRPLTQPDNSDEDLDEEDSDEQNPGVIFEDYSPHSVQETTKKTNGPEQSPTALAQADIELEKDLFRIIHHGDHMNITINDFFGRPPRVNGAGKKCIRKNTHVDTLDYDPAVPIPGRNRFCEPENKLVNKFTVPPQCCGPQFACPLHIQYTGPGTGIDTAKNLAIQRDCRCELDFYKCLEENRNPAELHPFFLFLHDSCLIKKADVSNTQPIGFRVINTAEFIAFPMYN